MRRTVSRLGQVFSLSSFFHFQERGRRQGRAFCDYKHVINRYALALWQQEVLKQLEYMYNVHCMESIFVSIESMEGFCYVCLYQYVASNCNSMVLPELFSFEYGLKFKDTTLSEQRKILRISSTYYLDGLRAITRRQQVSKQVVAILEECSADEYYLSI